MTKPALNPIEAPDLVCTECGRVLRRVIKTRDSNGKLDEIIYHCDSPKCQYAMAISKEHKNAQNATYEPPVTMFQADNPIPSGTYTLTTGLGPVMDEEADEAAEDADQAV